MPELLKTVDTWFLVIAVVLCGGGFLFLANRSFSRFDATIDRFENLFDQIFDRNNNLESRLSRLEGEHAARHKD